MTHAKNVTHEIAFIDPTVGDIETLIRGLRPEVAAARLDAATPAPAQIARALAPLSELDAVHVIAHGAPGEVCFGAGTLSLATIDEHRADLAAIGRALAQHGRLLLWSCQTGQGARATAFVEALAGATDANVAAATGLVGAAARGGRWELQGRQPATPALPPLTARGQAAYAGVLATSTTVNDNNTSVDENITTTTTNATINLNNSGGDDTVNADDSGNVTVNGNNSTGNDCIAITGASSATVNLNNSTGNDDVLIASTTVNATVNDNNSGITGGADHIDIAGVTVAATVNLNNSVGNDDVTVAGTNSTNATVNLNNSTGNDIISIGSMIGATTATVNLNNSTGTDIIHVLGATTTATVNLTNSTGQRDYVMLVGAGTGTINATNSTGADTLIGDDTTDMITGGSGGNTVDLMGAGTIYAGSGNDTGIYTLSDHYGKGGGADYYYGQGGTNRLEIYLTSANDTPTVETAIGGYYTFLATHPGVNQTYTFNFGNNTAALTVAGWQTLDVIKDGTTLTPLTPVIMVPGTQLLGIGHAGAISGVMLSENDNIAGETFTVTLTDATGKLSANTSAPGGGGTITGSGTTHLTITGSLSQVNSDLATLQDSDPAASSDTITVTAIDSFGNTAAPQTIAVDSCLYIAEKTATLTPVHTLIGSLGPEPVEFVVSGLDGPGTGTLTLSDGSETTTVSVTGNGTYTADLSGTAWLDGTVRSSLTFLDAAETAYFVATGAPVTLDKDTGDSATLTGPAGTLGSVAASHAAFTVTGLDDGESGSLTLSDAGHSLTLAVAGNGTYTADLSAWGDDTVSATLNVSDAANNSFSATASAVIDPDHGDSATLTGPAGTLGSVAASHAAFTVTGLDDGESGSLTLSDAGHSLTLAVAGNGTYTADLSAWGDDTVSATLNVSDAANNSFSATASAVIDPDHGDSATLTGPAGTLGSVAASHAAFTVTGLDDGESGSLTLSDAGHSLTLAVAGNGTYTADLSAWGDDTVSATLNVSDAANNSFSATASAVIDPDHGDSATLTGPAGTLGSVAASHAAFTVTGLDDGESGSLTLSDAGHSLTLAVAGNGTYTADLSAWGDDTVSATLNVSDAANNSFSATASAVIDPDHGDSATLTGPAGTLGSVAASHAAFTVTGLDDGESGSLTLSDAGHSLTLAVAGNGTYTADLSAWGDDTVSATLNVSDAANNSFSATASAVIDPDHGDSATLTGPAGTLGSVAASHAAFTVTGLDDGESGSLTLSDAGHSLTLAVAGNGTYTADLSAWGDDTVSATLNVSDAANNSFSATASAVIDPDHGDSATLTGPAGTLGSVAASHAAFTVTGLDDGESGSLTLSDAGHSLTLAVAGNGTYTADLSAWGDDTVSATLNVSDAANNSFSATASAVIDPDHGDSATLTGPAGTLGSVAASHAAFTVTGLDDGESGSLTLSDAGHSLTLAVAGNGTYTADLSAWGDDTVSATLNVSDAANNSFSATASAVIDPDHGDSATLTGPAGTLGSVAASHAAFTVTGLDDGESGSLTLSDAGHSLTLAVAGNGTYTADLSAWGDDTVSATLNVSDAANNSFSATASAVIDPDHGDSATLTGPAGTLGSVAASHAAFTVTGLDDGESGSLTLSDAGHSLTLAVAGNGTYTADLSAWGDDTVSATLNVSDAANNSFSATASAVIDPDHGDSATLTGPAGTLGSVAASHAAFTVTGLDDGESGSLTLSDAGHSLTLAVAGNGTYTADLSAWGDDTVSATLNVSDAANNSFSATASAVIDPDHGDSATLTGPAGTLGSVAASHAAFTVTGLDDGESGSLTLSDAGHSLTLAVAGNGTYTADLSAWGDDTVSATLNVSDAANNSFSATASAVIDPDHGDSATLTGPAGTLGSVAASHAAFTVTGLDDGESGSLTLSDAGHSLTLAVAGNGTYTADLSAWGDDTVSATLNVSDAANNSFSATASAVIDPDHGDSATLTGPAGTLGSVAASHAAFTVTGLDDGESGSLTLSDAGHSLTLAVAGNGTYTADLSAWGDDTVSATLNVSDAANNSFSATASAVIDPDHGDSATLTGPAGTLGSVAASHAAFTVTGLDDGESGSLTLSDAGHSLTLAVAGNGTYTADLSAWGDDTVSATLNVSDAANNSFSATASAVIDPDHGDSATLTGPAGTLGSVAASHAAFTVTGLDDGESGSLTLSDAGHSLTLAVAGNGTYTADLSAWGDDTVSATLNVSDAANNSFSATASAVIDPDHGDSATLTFPKTLFGSAGAGAVTFSITGLDAADNGGGAPENVLFVEGGTTVTVAVTGNGTYTANLSGLADGTISDTLTFVDVVGNTFSATGANITLDKDTTEHVAVAPVSTLVGSAGAGAVLFAVSGLDSDDHGSLTLTDSNGGSTTVLAVSGNGTYTANLVGGSFGDGTISSSLTITDSAGNSFSASGAAVALDKDTGETATLAIDNPTETFGSATATFVVSGLDAADTGGAGNTGTVSFVEGTQTVTVGVTGNGTYTADLSGLTNGTVTTSLSFTDAAGNSFPASGGNVTLVAPVPTVTSSFTLSAANGKGVTGTISDSETGTITLLVSDAGPHFTGSLGTTMVVETAANTPVSFSISVGAHIAANGDTIVLTAWEGNGATVSVTSIAKAPAGAAGSPIDLALTDPGGGETVTVTVAGVPTGWSLNAGTNLGNGTWAVATSDPSTLAVTPPSSFAGAVVLNVSESWSNPDGSTGSEFVSDNVEAYAPGNPIFALSGDDTLTGSGTNDVFVFAQPIGNDRIDNFNPANGTIDLIGFAGIASYADLAGNIADDAGGNAVITLGSGETITIEGVGAASLGAGNFLFNQEPITTNAAAMTVADGAMLPLGGTIDNTGTIALDSTGDGAELEVQIRGVTLQGGGQLVLSDDSQNLVVGGDASAVLDNVNNTISGAGQLGGGTLTIDNEGVIDATGSNALVIDTGANAVTNTGTLEAEGAGGLVVKSAVTGGGAAEIGGSSSIEFAAASDAAVGFVAGASGGALKLDQSGAFSGTVSGFTGYAAIDLADIVDGQNLTVGYAANTAGSGGTLTVSDGTHIANLALLGQYAAASDFATAADSSGGTVVTLSDPTQNHLVVGHG